MNLPMKKCSKGPGPPKYPQLRLVKNPVDVYCLDARIEFKY